jgi:hypothetical protein
MGKYNIVGSALRSQVDEGKASHVPADTAERITRTTLALARVDACPAAE